MDGRGVAERSEVKKSVLFEEPGEESGAGRREREVRCSWPALGAVHLLERHVELAV